MIAVFIGGVVAGLTVAWGYICSLNATIRVCKVYIHDRIDQQAAYWNLPDNGAVERCASTDKRSLCPTDKARLGTLQKKRIEMVGQPQLIVTSFGKSRPIDYVCSLCGRIFPLPEEQSPKEAAAALYSRFKDHIRQDHPETSPLFSAKLA